MSNLRKEQIVKGEDGKNWIKMKRQKTGKFISVPILPVAQKIINVYAGELDKDKVAFIHLKWEEAFFVFCLFYEFSPFR